MKKNSAIIVGGELNGLGVVRSLARQGIPVVVVETENRAALWSRYVHRYVVRSFSGLPFIEDIIALGKTFDQPPIVILTNEDAVHSFSEHRHELSRWFRFRLPPDEKVKLLSNKSSFHRFAEANGFPVPQTIVLQNLYEINRLAFMRFPCALKPDDNRDRPYIEKYRTIRANSLQEAKEFASTLLRAGRTVVAQQWIEGPEQNICFTLFYRGAEAKIVSIFTGRKLLCSPRDVGNTAICIAAPEVSDELGRMTIKFADCVDFEGMGSMEYKWDNISNKFIMVEPTVGRTDWQEEIATLSGVNIPLDAYRYELGLTPLLPAANIAPVAWRATFMNRLPSHVLRPNMKIVDGYFRWNDPLPALKYYCMHNPIHRVMRRLGKCNRPEIKTSMVKN